MRQTTLALLVSVIVVVSGVALAQEVGKPPKASIIKAGRLIDVRAGRVLNDQAIVVEGERIKSVGPADEIVKSADSDAAVI